MNTAEIEKKLPTLEKAPRELLIAEIQRLWNNEEITYETHLKFDEWTDAFFKAQGLEHLIEPYHDYISDCLDNEDE